jgi:PPOX class probable F420-dependent enzyme
MRRRVAEARVARLGTVTADGRPHLVPCCFALDRDVIYTGVDAVKSKSTRALRRLDNIRAQPATCLLVDHYDDDWSALWWVRLDGDARVLEDGSSEELAGRALLAEKYPQYRGDGLPGPLIAVGVTRWTAWP